MKKLLVLLLVLVLAGCASLSIAKQGPRWERTTNATLHNGFYLICNQFDLELAPECTVLVAEGTEEEMLYILKALNEPPVIAPEVEAMWFYWDIDNWLKLKPPLKYVP